MRSIALALFVLALANPSITREDRDPLTSVAVVVIDKSASQEFADRTAQTEAARAQVAERLGRIPNLEVRFVEAGQSDGETDGTRLFTALTSALADVPQDRIAGAIMITDGRVHDLPTDFTGLGFSAPVHGLITGHANERDRRVVLVTTPRFGIVGQNQAITFKIEDQGASPGTAQVTIRRDGEQVDSRSVRVGQQRQRQRADCPCRPEHRRDRGRADRQRTDRGQQPRRGLDRRRARQAARAAGFGRAACRRAHLAQPAQVGRLGRPRALHHPAPAGEAGRHADQRAVADRVSDARAVPAEDQRLPAHHLRSLCPPGRAADHLFRQHRPLRAQRRRRPGRGRSRLRQPDQPLAHAARSRPAGRAERPHHRRRVSGCPHRARQASSGDARPRRLGRAIRRTGASGSGWSTAAPARARR